MKKQYLLCFAAILIVCGIGYGSYQAYTVQIPELHHQTIQAQHEGILNYDFSEFVGSDQVISRLVISISGSFTPGIGYFDGEYGPLDGSEIEVRPFDNYWPLGGGVDFSKENTQFFLELDSEKMVGTDYVSWDEPYPGYSGDVAGSINFSFIQWLTLSTTVESWPVIEIAEATYTLYLIPEPASALLLAFGGLLLKKKRA